MYSDMFQHLKDIAYLINTIHFEIIISIVNCIYELRDMSGCTCTLVVEHV